MQLSQKCDYALRAMLKLAQAQRSGRRLSIPAIAAEDKIPRKFLEQILLILKHRGLVTSRMGSKGGYSLVGTPEQITFGMVMRAIDGSLAPLACVENTEICPEHAQCGFRFVMTRLHSAISGVVDSTTLADALRTQS